MYNIIVIITKGEVDSEKGSYTLVKGRKEIIQTAKGLIIYFYLYLTLENLNIVSTSWTFELYLIILIRYIYKK